MEITIPNSVTLIRVSNITSGSAVSAFYRSTNLTNIYFAAGENDIPENAPWGAENATVTKLEQEQNQDTAEETTEETTN